MKMFHILSDQFLFLQTLYLLFHLEQPIAVSTSYFLRMFSLLSRLFFNFPVDKLLLQFLGFVLIWWYVGMSLVISCRTSKRCFWFPGQQFTGWQVFSQYFSRLLFSVSPDHVCGCIPFFFTNYHLRIPKFILFVCFSLLSSSELLPAAWV